MAKQHRKGKLVHIKGRSKHMKTIPENPSDLIQIINEQIAILADFNKDIEKKTPGQVMNFQQVKSNVETMANVYKSIYR